MNKEIKSFFQSTLAEMLRSVASRFSGVKASKNGLKIICPYNGKVAGELFFEYLRNAGGVYVGCEVSGGVVHEMCYFLGSEWRSNLLNNSTLSFNSLSEENREFSNEVGGVIRLYDRMNIQEVVSDVEQKITQFHLMRILNLVGCRSELLNDVKIHPEYYSRPIVISALCLEWNNMEDIYLQLAALAKDKRYGSVDVRLLTEKISSLDLSIPLAWEYV